MGKTFFSRIKIIDVFLFILFILIIVYFSMNVIFNNKTKTKQLIIESGKNIWYYQLDKDKEIKIEGILGESTIKIENESVYFLNSPCPNKICILSKPISKNGDWQACLPNGIFIRIEGNEEETTELDATSY